MRRHSLATVVAGALLCLGVVGCVRKEVTPPLLGEEPLTTAQQFQTEVWATPLLLLPGVALLIVSTSARFGQLQGEFHHLLDHPGHHPKIVARSLVKRARMFRDALVCLYASVASFSAGSLVGALLDLWTPYSLYFIGGLTLFGIIAVVIAAIQLMRESLVCLEVIDDHHDQLERFSDVGESD